MVLRRGNLIAEFPTFREAADHVRDVVFIYDEADADLGVSASPQVVRSYTSYLRKRNQVLLLPSVQTLCRAVSGFRVVRTLNCLLFGLPLWLYQWSVDLGVGYGKKRFETGSYQFWRPSRVWGWYDHREEPGDTWYVYDWRFGSRWGVWDTVASSGSDDVSLGGVGGGDCDAISVVSGNGQKAA
jgi:hypothetical protein